MFPGHALNALGRWLKGPPRCHLCLATVGQGLICEICRGDLPLSGAACPRCAARLGGGRGLCGQCLKEPPVYQGAISPLDYRFPVDRLILALKFKSDMVAGQLLGQLLADSLLEVVDDLPQALVPMPLHPARLRQRGFNQAGEIASWVGRRLALPLLEAALLRSRAGPPQSTLGAAARRANVRGAFTVSERGGPLPRHVALLDDVLTTGATAGEAARALLAGGAQQVTVWTVARAFHARRN